MSIESQGVIFSLKGFKKLFQFIWIYLYNYRFVISDIFNYDGLRFKNKSMIFLKKFKIKLLLYKKKKKIVEINFF